MLRKAQQPCSSRIIHSRIANAIFQMISAKNSSAQPQAAWPLYHPRMANAHIQTFRQKKEGQAASGLAFLDELDELLRFSGLVWLSLRGSHTNLIVY